MQPRQSKLLAVGNGEVFCQIAGDRPNLLIAVPGYGVTLDFFDPALPFLTEQYTVWTFDLPAHGQTIWNAEEFAIADFTEIIRRILAETGKSTFALLGHSFGGRTVLTQIPVFAPQLEQVFLLAPDGIKTTSLMTMRYIPRWFRKITKHRFEKSRLMLPIAGWLYRAKFLPRHLYSFAQHYLKNEERRRQVAIYWLSLANFQVDLSEVKRFISTYNIKLLVVLGRQDRVIPMEVGRLMQRGVEAYVEVAMVEAGHLMEGGAVLKPYFKTLSS